MPIIKSGGWYSVQCEGCGRVAFNEAIREDAITALRESNWSVLYSGYKPMKDYCPDCAEAMQRALEERREK